MMASSIALAFRSNCAIVMLLGGCVAVGAQDADRVQTLERQVTQQQRLIRDWGGLIHYGSDNSELPPPAKGEDRVIFFGDQITEYWGRGQPFFPGKPWLNRGIAGQTTDQMLIRFRQDVIALDAKAVVILGGLNDVAGVHGVSSEETVMDNLVSMAELAHANGIRVVFASVLPVCDCFTKGAPRQRWQERISELNALIEKYCAKTGAIYLDYYFSLAHDDNFKKGLTKDGVIPNDEGYKVMARLAEMAVTEALKKK
jgi:lysophospholipase L1-like esterase